MGDPYTDIGRAIVAPASLDLQYLTGATLIQVVVAVEMQRRLTGLAGLL
jgi:hypothetical protein